MIPFLSFTERHRRYQQSMMEAVTRVFRSGWFILGPEVEAFEKAFSRYLGVENVAGVNSGTDALCLALRALGVGPGDEVITVANTATPTISAIRMTGAMPVFVDVLRDSQTMNPALVETAVTQRTRAIVPVHLYGYPADMKEIMSVAMKYKLSVVEDACQAHGATYDGRMVGTIGDAGCFSFYPTKNLGAAGDAGAVVSRNAQVIGDVKALRNYGEVAKYINHIEGVNSRMDEIQAALLNWGLPYLEQWNNQRAKLAALYRASLKGLPVEIPLCSDNLRGRVWHLFVIKCAKRDDLKRYLREREVETAIHYPIPISHQVAYQFLGYQTSDLPVTEALAQDILSLPLYPELSEKDVSFISATVREFYGTQM